MLHCGSCKQANVHSDNIERPDFNEAHSFSGIAGAAIALAGVQLMSIAKHRNNISAPSDSAASTVKATGS
jgi:hypothetical protein